MWDQKDKNAAAVDDEFIPSFKGNFKDTWPSGVVILILKLQGFLERNFYSPELLIKAELSKVNLLY